MSSTAEILCDCGAAVAFTADDRGLDVYCPSCGRACAVPIQGASSQHIEPAIQAEPNAESLSDGAKFTAQAAVDSASSRRRVFAAGHPSGLGERTAYTAVCRCGCKTPVTIEEVGQTLYCPTCGAELPTPEKNEAVALSVVEEESTQLAQAAPSHRRWTGVFGVLLAVAGISSVVWSYRERLGFATPSESAADTSPQETTPPEPEITLLDVKKLLDLPDVEQAVAECNRLRRSLRTQRVPHDDPRLVELNRVYNLLTLRPAYIRAIARRGHGPTIA